MKGVFSMFENSKDNEEINNIREDIVDIEWYKYSLVVILILQSVQEM